MGGFLWDGRGFGGDSEFKQRGLERVRGVLRKE